MFVDKTRIYIKAGNGGDGKVNFYRDTMTMFGGPDGGDGGKGGDVIAVADNSLNNLVDYYYTKHFKAENGENGGKSNAYGKSGADLILKVPCGTIITEAETGKIIADMVKNGERKVLVRGGNGGRGNSKFANSRRQTPTFSETGEKTKEYAVDLELKTIADVGLIGFPSVGKSKILSVLTSAKPKIAAYHFTTLTPNLGVVKYYDKSFVIADIPGLIEGASEGKGLGHEFLKHIERTKILLHIVDIAGVDGRDPLEDFEIINKELRMYNKEVANSPQIVVLNKIDLLYEENKEKLVEFKEKYSKDYKIIEFSAALRQGIDELLNTVIDELNKLPDKEAEVSEVYEIDKRDYTTFEISREDDGTFVVSGGLIDQMSRGIILSDPESFAYFQRRLKQNGIIDKLIEKGLQEGDYVRIGNFEFEYIE